MTSSDGLRRGLDVLEGVLRAIPGPSARAVGADGQCDVAGTGSFAFDAYYRAVARVCEVWLGADVVGDGTGDDGKFDGSGYVGRVGRKLLLCAAGGVAEGVAAVDAGEASNVVSGFEGAGRLEPQVVVVDASVKLGGEKVKPVGAGRNWERNEGWREKKKLRKLRRKSKQIDREGVDSVPEWRRGSAANVGSDQVSELQESLQAKWKAENALRAFEAERKLRLLQSQDEDALIKMQRAQVLRTTETCKVQVEKAFKSLKKDGNVPADGPGSAETVVSEGGVPSLSRSNGDTISPDSSASMHEFRAAQKENLDLRAKVEKISEALGYLEYSAPEAYKDAMFKANCKKAYTLDSQGEPEIDTVGSIHSDGKFYPSYLHTGYLPNPAHRNTRNEVPFKGEEDLW